MRFRESSVWLSAAGVMLLAVTVACGGGSPASSSPPPVPPVAALTITTGSPLPGTLRNHAYSATLSAANGQGALHWSISPLSSTTLFVDGISIDPDTGVLSGNANFAGTGGFMAKVTDSASSPRTATKTFTITASDPLQPPLPQATMVQQFSNFGPMAPEFQGGVFPFTFSLTGGSLPPGLRIDNLGRISGSAIVLGTFVSTLTIQDSFSPPEVVSGQVTLKVVPPPLAITDSLPRQILKDRPFSGRVIATGGSPPYHFSLQSGSSLPPGVGAIDPSSGQVNGTPTTLGNSFLTVAATDSSSPPLTASGSFSVTVVQAQGRNDTVATATPIGNGVTEASISPYIDPPGNAPVAGDNDYYKLVSLSGSLVHLETQAAGVGSGALDSVIEVVDGNGNQYSTCRQPGDASSTFTGACINDDISTSPSVLDSALDFKVPGAANTSITFYVHVLDWRGDARPDMRYALQVSGIAAPLSIVATPLLPAARGLSYNQQLSNGDGIGTVSWSIASGSLPANLNLDSLGAITGVATTDGTYAFSVRATDSGSPPQTTTAQEVIKVVEPVTITSPGTWPDACVGLPYSFTVQTTGGSPPLAWGFFSNQWVGINLDQSTGTFSGFSIVSGTFQGTVSVIDATTHGVSQLVSLTVKQCP